jgi:NTE family protein
MFKNISITILFLMSLVRVNYAGQADTLKLNLVKHNLPFGLSREIPAEFEDIALVLSGGGSRGFAHVGVLKFLEENNIPFSSIYGTSMGAIIGGMYASGYSIAEMDSILTSTEWNDFFNFEKTKRNQLFLEQKRILDNAILSVTMENMKPVIPKAINSGLLSYNFFSKIACGAPVKVDKDFSKLLYPFHAVATNLLNGNAVKLDSGSLSTALRASSSVTFLMAPVPLDSMLLVDGGIVANIPVNIAKRDGNKFVIAVNVTSPLRTRNELNYPWEIADQLVSLPMKKMNEKNLANADFVITPKLGEVKGNVFENLKSIEESGYKERAKIDLLKKAIIKHIEAENRACKKVYSHVKLSSSPSKYERALIKLLSSTDSVSKAELYFALYQIKNRFNLQAPQLIITPLKKGVSVKIDLGRQPVVNKIRFTGLSGNDSLFFQKKSKILLGKRYSEEKSTKFALMLLRHFRGKGEISLSLNRVLFDSSKSDLLFVFENFLYDGAIINGTHHTLDFVVEREIECRKGKPVLAKQLSATLENLRSIDLFSSIEVSALCKNSKVKLKFNLKEKPWRFIRLGMKIDNEYYSRIFLDIRNENLFGDGSQLGFTFFGGLKSQFVSVEHIAPRIFKSFFTYRLRFLYQGTQINTFKIIQTKNDHILAKDLSGTYEESHLGGELSLGRQIKHLGSFFVSWKLLRDKIYNIHNYSGSGYSKLISALNVNLIIDSRNFVPFTTSGIYFNAFYETANNQFESELPYTKFGLDYQGYFALSNVSTLVSRINLGLGDETLPLSQQFSMGGADSFYGMRDYEVRGRQIILTSLKYRYKLPFKIFFDSFVSVRYDLGNIWEGYKKVKFKDLKHGIGLALAIDTPIGPAKFSMGKSFFFKNTLSKNIIVRSPFQFYFSIGYYF